MIHWLVIARPVSLPLTQLVQDNVTLVVCQAHTSKNTAVRLDRWWLHIVIYQSSWAHCQWQECHSPHYKSANCKNNIKHFRNLVMEIIHTGTYEKLQWYKQLRDVTQEDSLIVAMWCVFYGNQALLKTFNYAVERAGSRAMRQNILQQHHFST